MFSDLQQDIARVDYACTPEQLTHIGRDVECAVLARAVTWPAQHRVLVNGHKTVVFPLSSCRHLSRLNTAGHFVPDN